MHQLSIDNWDFQGKPLVLDKAFMGSSKLKRKRGVVLTMGGCRRPWHTQLESEPQLNHGESYIYGKISEKIDLSSGSIEWILNRKKEVDRQSVQRLFRALTHHQNPLIIQCMILLQFALGMLYMERLATQS